MGGDVGLSGIRKGGNGGISGAAATPIFGEVTGGAANTLIMVSPSSPVTALIDGGIYIIRSDADVPGGLTSLDIDGVGARDVVKYNTTNPDTGDILADIDVTFIYDEPNDFFQSITFMASEVSTALDSATNTGVITGGEVTINADPTKYNVAAGTGVVYNWVSPGTPLKIPVTWGAFTATSPPDSTKGFTVNGIDSTGALVHGGGALNESGVSFTDQQERIIIPLQAIQTLDGVNVDTVSPSSRPAYEAIACIIDWIQSHSPLTTGNIYGDDTATTMAKAAGTTAGLFINRAIDPQAPSIKANPQVSTVSASGIFRDGVGGFTTELPSTTIVTDLFDDGSGVLATMANNKYAIRRCYFFGETDLTVMTYGQVEYASLADAKAAIFNEDPVINPLITFNGAFTTALVHMKSGDLTDPTEAEFVVISLESIGGGAQTIIPPDSVTNIELANMAANTVKVNNTGSLGDPVDMTMPSNTFLVRLSAGNIVPGTIAEVKVLLQYFQNGGESTGDGRTIGNIDSFPLDIITNNTDRISILADGKVGVNKSAPDEQLHIVGNVKIEGQAWENVQTTLTPGGTTQTITWNDGNYSVVDLESATGDVTLTLNNGNAGAFYFIEIRQDSTTPRDIIWPASVLWPDGTAPVISTGANAVDSISMAYNGTNYLATVAPNFS